jgi:hypothetical protein
VLYYQASNILRLRMLGVQISYTSRPPCLRGCCLDTYVFMKNVALVGWSKVVTWIWSLMDSHGLDSDPRACLEAR